jgi:dihydroorotate dehydrogenase
VLYRLFARPLLFLLPAETAHRLVMRMMALAAGLRWKLAGMRWWFGRPAPSLRLRVWDRDLPSPIGLAAGLDKDAEAFEAFAALGFGFVEVGTLTAKAQPGNPQPRLFRLPEDRALINRMGFNNRGAADAATRLAKPRDCIVGANIGRSKVATDEEASEDYASSAAVVARHADYVVVNVSSPNTIGLRDLQAITLLRPLLERVRAALDTASPTRHVPLLVKIAPDLADEDIDEVAELALELHLDGIIATNTTISRAGLKSGIGEIDACGPGGLSGQPLRERSVAVLARLRARVGTRCVLVSVGGVADVDDVWARLQAGATLVQVYTAVIYDGPGLPARLNRGVARRLADAGLDSVADAIGASAPAAARPSR